MVYRSVVYIHFFPPIENSAYPENKVLDDVSTLEFDEEFSVSEVFPVAKTGAQTRTHHVKPPYPPICLVFLDIAVKENV